jgi:hypothetical protein
MADSDDEEFALEVLTNPVEKAARSVILSGYNLQAVTGLVRKGDIEEFQQRLEDQVIKSLGGVNLFDEYGLTFLHYATAHGHLQMVRFLVHKSAAIDQKTESDGRTALHLAVQMRHPTTVHFLLRNGADPTILDNRKLTPKDYAVDEELKQLLWDGQMLNELIDRARKQMDQARTPTSEPSMPLSTSSMRLRERRSQ